MLSIFSEECFIIFPSCAAEVARNDDGGGSSAGRRSLKFFVFSSFLGGKAGRVSVTPGNNQ